MSRSTRKKQPNYGGLPKEEYDRLFHIVCLMQEMDDLYIEVPGYKIYETTLHMAAHLYFVAHGLGVNCITEEKKVVKQIKAFWSQGFGIFENGLEETM